MRQQVEVIYPTLEQAEQLVDRIERRVKAFSYTMSEEEKEAMSNLFQDVGVTVDQLLDVYILADNYAINAEIVRPEDVNNYNEEDLEEALFTWEEENGTHYCLQW